METGKKKLETGNWKLEVGVPAGQGRLSSFEFPVSSFQFPISSFEFSVSSFQFRISSFLLTPAKWLAGAAVAMAGLFWSVAAYAQGCAMCYTSASAAKAGAIQALRHGILILLGPTIVMFAVIGVVVFRSRNRFRGEPEWNEEAEDRSQKSEESLLLLAVSSPSHVRRTTDGN